MKVGLTATLRSLIGEPEIFGSPPDGVGQLRSLQQSPEQTPLVGRIVRLHDVHGLAAADRIIEVRARTVRAWQKLLAHGANRVTRSSEVTPAANRRLHSARLPGFRTRTMAIFVLSHAAKVAAEIGVKVALLGGEFGDAVPASGGGLFGIDIE